MTYALVKDGEVVSTHLPEVGELQDGRKVSGFDKLDADSLKRVGWLPIEDPGPPAYDEETQTVNRSYSVGEHEVTVVYTVDDIPTPEPTPVESPSTQEQVDSLLSKLVEKGTITQAESDEIKEPM